MTIGDTSSNGPTSAPDGPPDHKPQACTVAPQVVVYADVDPMLSDIAHRLLRRLAAGQATGRPVSVVLTGGGTGTGVLRQLRASPQRDTVDWSHVDVFWSDERFVPADDPQRNERQAREALLDHVGVDRARVHAMPSADGIVGDDADAAAEHYDAVLRNRLPQQGSGFDVCLLGVGEEGHVASIFPDSPALRAGDRRAVAVHDCPKPPPTRLSLTLATIRRADEVWLITAGASKAEAVAAALTPDVPESRLPAAGARGLTNTIWFLDASAAGLLPPR